MRVGQTTPYVWIVQCRNALVEGLLQLYRPKSVTIVNTVSGEVGVARALVYNYLFWIRKQFMIWDCNREHDEEIKKGSTWDFNIRAGPRRSRIGSGVKIIFGSVFLFFLKFDRNFCFPVLDMSCSAYLDTVGSGWMLRMLIAWNLFIACSR